MSILKGKPEIVSAFIDDESTFKNQVLVKMLNGRKIILICALNATVTIGAMNTGMLTVLLPKMGEDLHLSLSLLLWYVQPFSHVACKS